MSVKSLNSHGQHQQLGGVVADVSSSDEEKQKVFENKLFFHKAGITLLSTCRAHSPYA